MSKLIPVYDSEGKLTLEKRPKEHEELPMKKKIKNSTFILEKVEHPVMEGKLLFEVREYEDNKLVQKKQYHKYEDALRGYRKMIVTKKKEKK